MPNEDAGQVLAVPQPRYRIRKGSVAGGGHKRIGLNNQDSLLCQTVRIGDREYTIGFVSDGCTGKEKNRKSRTEVGATLLPIFAASEIRLMLAAHMRLQDIPGTLYQRCVSYIGNLARSTVVGTAQEIWSIIDDCFLCTLHGFIMDDKEIVFLSAGDGILIVNDNVTIINQQDKPEYLAFHLFDRRLLEAKGIKLPSNFNTSVYELGNVRRFAVSTDGLKRKKAGTQEPFVDPEDVNAIWAHEPAAPAGLQWWLNIQSNVSGRLSDDTTIIAANETVQSSS